METPKKLEIKIIDDTDNNSEHSYTEYNLDDASELTLRAPPLHRMIFGFAFQNEIFVSNKTGVVIYIALSSSPMNLKKIGLMGGIMGLKASYECESKDNRTLQKRTLVPCDNKYNPYFSSFSSFHMEGKEGYLSAARKNEQGYFDILFDSKLVRKQYKYTILKRHLTHPVSTIEKFYEM